MEVEHAQNSQVQPEQTTLQDQQQDQQVYETQPDTQEQLDNPDQNEEFNMTQVDYQPTLLQMLEGQVPQILHVMESPSELVNYPQAEIEHETMVQDSELFYQAQEHLQKVLGFMPIPQENLQYDLHKLYVKVCSFQGLLETMLQRKWEEIAQSFDISDPLSQQSQELAVLYGQQLWHFEQVFLHKNSGPILEPPVPIGEQEIYIDPDQDKVEYVENDQQMAEAVQPTQEGLAMYEQPQQASKTQQPAARPKSNNVSTPAQPRPSSKNNFKKRKEEPVHQQNQQYNPSQIPPSFTALPASMQEPSVIPIGASIQGRVDAKFDVGFFCTIEVNGQKFKGILYSPANASNQEYENSYLQANDNNRVDLTKGNSQDNHQYNGSDNYAVVQPTPYKSPIIVNNQPTRAAPMSSAMKKDPNRPKNVRSSFNYYCGEARARAKEQYPDLDQHAISRVLGEWWSKLSEAEKAPFNQLASEDKERFQKENREYNEKLNSQYQVAVQS